jgi:hypothetical protein
MDPTMDNPWVEIKPKMKSYILKKDAKKLEELKKTCQFRLELLPEPFLGSLDAPVVLLNLNPGYNKNDIIFHKQKLFQQLSLANLRQINSEYPFFF